MATTITIRQLEKMSKVNKQDEFWTDDPSEHGCWLPLNDLLTCVELPATLYRSRARKADPETIKVWVCNALIDCFEDEYAFDGDSHNCRAELNEEINSFCKLVAKDMQRSVTRLEANHDTFHVVDNELLEAPIGHILDDNMNPIDAA